MKLKLQFTKTIIEEKTIEFESNNFISINHTENGSKMVTAFINKALDKWTISIKVSPHGGVLEIHRIPGEALFHAKKLLEKDIENTVCQNSTFINLYQKQKSVLAISLGVYYEN